MASFESPSCAKFVWKATTARMCNILDSLVMAPTSDNEDNTTPPSPPITSTSLQGVREGLCLDSHAEPFTLDFLPRDGSRIYGHLIPVRVGVRFSPDLPLWMKEAYSQSCTVHVLADGVGHWNASLSEVIDERDLPLDELKSSVTIEVGGDS